MLWTGRRETGGSAMSALPQILLKKSADALDPIFSAPLARFHNEDAEGLIARRRRDADRSKWSCEASNSRS
jgi:hypothetical protein